MRVSMFQKSLLLCAAVIAVPAYAHEDVTDALATETPGDTQTDDNAIVVTAARTILPVSALPLTVDVIDALNLSQQVAISGSIVDAVSTLSPSFSPTRQKLSGFGETLRGRSPLYAINGISQSTPIRDSSRDGFSIDPFFIDRIELIYGSNALQGIGATGGVVNQVTVGAPKNDGIQGRALVQGSADGGFSSNGFGGKVAGLIGWRGGALDATIGAAYETRGAFYDGKGRMIGVDGTQGDLQTSKSWSIFGRFGWQVSDTGRFDLLANRFELKGDGEYIAVSGNVALGIPTTAKRGTPPGFAPANRVETVALTYTDSDIFGGNFSGQIFANRSRDLFGGSIVSTFQDANIAPIGTLFDQSFNRSRKFGGKFSYERKIVDGLTGTIGFDALFDNTAQLLKQTGRAWVPPTEFRSLAPFGQLNLSLFDNIVRLSGGLRHESVQLKVADYTTLASANSTKVSGGKPSFSDTLINGGVVVEPVTGVRFYASYAEGYTVPDVGRILRAINKPNIDVDNFIDISPIISNNREIGIELKRGPVNASISYFWSSSKLGQFLIAGPGGSFDVARQRVEIQGLELSINTKTPIAGLDLSAGYAHLTGRTDSNADGKVDIGLDGGNISPDRVNLAAIYASGPFSARAQMQYYLSRNFANKQNFGGYTIADLSVRYDTERFGAISLSAQNIFDKYYLGYNSQTTSSTDPLRLYAGRGRTITVGLDYRF